MSVVFVPHSSDFRIDTVYATVVDFVVSCPDFFFLDYLTQAHADTGMLKLVLIMRTLSNREAPMSLFATTPSAVRYCTINSCIVAHHLFVSYCDLPVS